MRRNKDLYQIPESLTPAADSRISVDVIQHGKQLLEGLPCLLRFHFALTLTRLNCTTWRGDRAIPIRPDVFWRLRRFTPPARARTRIGGVGPQIVRDWVLRFNAEGPDSLLNRKAPGVPSILDDNQRRALRQIVENGPIPAVHGVVRWRLIDLAQWAFEEFRVSISKQTLSRELRHMGFRKLAARPRHHAQDEEAAAALNNDSRRSW